MILAPCAAPKRSRPATRISRPQGTPTHDPRSNPGAASSDHESCRPLPPGSGCTPADHPAGRGRRRRPEHRADGETGTGRAGGLPLAREVLPFRPRADPERVLHPRGYGAHGYFEVADGLGLPELPEPVAPAREPIRGLPASPALSILANGPDSLAGRKIGILVTDGTDAAMLTAVRSAAAAAKVKVELVTPTVGGIEASDGTRLPAGQTIDGCPSVLFNAVIIAPSAHGALALASDRLRGTSPPTPTRTASSSGIPPTPCRCLGPAGSLRSSTTALSASTAIRPPSSSASARSSGTGRVSRPASRHRLAAGPAASS